MTLTTFSDGNILYASELNTVYGMIHMKSFSSQATEYTTTGGWEDTGASFVLTTSKTNTMLLGCTLRCDLDSDSGTGAHVCLKVTGSSLGTKYISSIQSSTDTDAVDLPVSMWETQKDQGMIASNTTAYAEFIRTCSLFYPLPDTSTTFTVRLKRNSAAGTAKVRSISLILYYAIAYTSD